MVGLRRPPYARSREPAGGIFAVSCEAASDIIGSESMASQAGLTESDAAFERHRGVPYRMVISVADMMGPAWLR